MLRYVLASANIAHLSVFWLSGALWRTATFWVLKTAELDKMFLTIIPSATFLSQNSIKLGRFVIQRNEGGRGSKAAEE